MLLDQLTKYKVVLASRSPRRQNLLKELGIHFEVLTNHEIEEVYPADLSKEMIAVFLAELKASAVMPVVPSDTILITADTIVWMKDEVVQKPRDYQDAILILKKLSGSVHEVHTGVCLRSGSNKSTFNASTRVYFADLADDEITYYVKQYKPYDKAGAYGIQEWIGYIGIEKIEGSYFNVMGLPVHKLYVELKKFIESIKTG